MNRQEKEDQFEWWITCIPDKIAFLKLKLPIELSKKMDHSLHSVDILEQYLLDNYSLDQLKSDPELWNCCASYLGHVYKMSIPAAEWFIELDDTKNVFYNKPSLRVLGKVNFVPHSYVSASIDRKKGNFISSIIGNHMRLITTNTPNS